MASGPFVSCKTLIGQIPSMEPRRLEAPNVPRYWLQGIVVTLYDMNGKPRVDIDDGTGICTVDYQHHALATPLVIGDYIMVIGHRRQPKLIAGTPSSLPTSVPYIIAHQIKPINHNEQPDAEALWLLEVTDAQLYDRSLSPPTLPFNNTPAAAGTTAAASSSSTPSIVIKT